MMKAILCLAFVCCFVAGALSAGCDCDERMLECACKPANKISKFIIIYIGFPVI